MHGPHSPIVERELTSHACYLYVAIRTNGACYERTTPPMQANGDTYNAIGTIVDGHVSAIAVPLAFRGWVDLELKTPINWGEMYFG